MNRIWNLYVGEIQRLLKYKILFFSLLVSAIWMIILVLSDAATAQALVPTLLVTDAGMMSILLLGASYYYEKQEGTMKSILVSPVSLSEVLLAKVAAAMTSGILSMLLVAGSAWAVHGIETNLFLMGVYVLATIAGNTAIGYVIILSSRDFMAMIVKFAGIAMVFYIPSLLIPLGIISQEWDVIAIISPIYAGTLLIESLYTTFPIGEILFALGYLVLIAGVLYPFIIYKKFLKVAIEG
jgi:fluoroquinolone transport system permease protein